MEFLKFFARRLNVSPSEASKMLEQALNNYRPTRDYSSRMLGTEGSTPDAAARALAANRSP